MIFYQQISTTTSRTMKMKMVTKSMKMMMMTRTTKMRPTQSGASIPSRQPTTGPSLRPSNPIYKGSSGERPPRSSSSEVDFRFLNSQPSGGSPTPTAMAPFRCPSLACKNC